VSEDPALPYRRDDLPVLAASGARFHVPLSEARARDLVAGLPIAPGRHVLDLGCGSGEVLMRVVSANPATTGTGVENVGIALRQAHRGLVERRLAERVEFVEDDPATFQDIASLVIALDAPGLFGEEDWRGAILDRLEPGGVVLVGADVVADDTGEIGGLATLASLAAWAGDGGYRVLRSDSVTRAELDAYEASVREGLAHAGQPDRAESRREAYGGEALRARGFALLVLGVS
jgi:SAM-dependent methyltransferase